MKSNTIIYIILAALIIGGIVFFLSSKFSQPDQVPIGHAGPVVVAGIEYIIMKPDSFEPAKMVVKKNTQVTFKNEDTEGRWPASNIHPTHGIYPEFDPMQPVEPEQQWSFVFDKVGTWKMHDHLIPSLTGEITVID